MKSINLIALSFGIAELMMSACAGYLTYSFSHQVYNIVGMGIGVVGIIIFGLIVTSIGLGVSWDILEDVFEEETSVT